MVTLWIVGFRDELPSRRNNFCAGVGVSYYKDEADAKEAQEGTVLSMASIEVIGHADADALIRQQIRRQEYHAAQFY